MTCNICNTELQGRQTAFCSRACSIKGNTIARLNSGRLRKSGNTPQEWAAKLARVRERAKPTVTKTCVVCLGVRVVKYRGLTEDFETCSTGCANTWRKNQNIVYSLGKQLVHVPAKPRVTPSCVPPVTVLKGSFFVAGACVICKASFVSPHAHNKTCSPRCARKLSSTSNWIPTQQRYAIYARDNWICQLCFTPVDRRLRYSYEKYQPKYPSLDHIKPRSLGGKHEADNLRLAHVGCNSARGIGDPSAYANV